MPLDADVAAQLELLASLKVPALSDGSVAEARANYDAAPKPAGDVVRLAETRSVPGRDGPIPVRVYCDREGTDLPIVVFFHGGGWVLSSAAGHDSLARRIAKRSGAMVVSVDYRLAPEHPFPAPHDDCWAATSWLAEHGAQWGGDPGRLAVCGDSAGGNLAAGIALRSRDEGLRLALQALVYPCIDDRQDGYASMTENAEGYFLSAADMRWFWDHYVHAAHRSNPYAVPARAGSLHDVAPAFIQTAEFDPLRDEGEAYGARLDGAGVDVEVIRYPGVVHGFVSRWEQMARALTAHADLGRALSDALGVDA